MDLPTVDNCCFGLLPLKTGAIIAGVVCFVVEAAYHGGETYYASGQDWIRTIYGILVIFGIISSILLIAGVLMDNQLMVKCFIIAFILLIIFSIILFILALLNRGGVTVNYIVSFIVYICVVGYCLIVANSYYKAMGG